MAITFSRFTRPGALYFDANANVWENGDVRALLVSTSHTFDPTAQFVDDISSDELTNDVGSGYERKTLGTKTRAIEQSVEIPGCFQESSTSLITRDIIKLSAAYLEYTDLSTNQRGGGGYFFVQNNDDTDSPVLGLFKLENDIPSDVTTLPTVRILPDTNLGFLHIPLL